MILVSLFHTSPLAPSLLLFADELKVVRSWELIGGAKGITHVESQYLVAHKSTTGACYISLVSLDMEGVRATTELPDVSDIHSLCIRNNKLFVVSSGTNKICVYDLIEFLKGPTSMVVESILVPDVACLPNEDEIHMNSICVANGEIFISAFGKKPTDGRWVDAESGYIQNALSHEILYKNVRHPHSLSFVDGSFWYCSSADKVIYRDAKALHVLDGYARGLALSSDKILFAATSSNRTYDKTSSEVSKIYSFVLSDDSLAPLHSVDIDDQNAEIYDILSVREGSI